jgi:hypothetical protein
MISPSLFLTFNLLSMLITFGVDYWNKTRNSRSTNSTY